MKPTLPLLVLVPALAAAAAPSVLLDSVVLSEQLGVVNGKPQTVLKTPGTVLPGDKLVFRTRYRNEGKAPATKVVVSNPLPAGVAFAGQASPGSDFSVDGGRTFGAFGALKVHDVSGATRAATVADVTTIRWTVATIAPGASGTLSYRGIVR